ncbi:MAG TPA: hypothetical protein ENN09_00785 [Planctomycetes bacterium]|nr:hypothetical protein [Planctomycetota bacterium]
MNGIAVLRVDRLGLLFIVLAGACAPSARPERSKSIPAAAPAKRLPAAEPAQAATAAYMLNAPVIDGLVNEAAWESVPALSLTNPSAR